MQFLIVVHNGDIHASKGRTYDLWSEQSLSAVFGPCNTQVLTGSYPPEVDIGEGRLLAIKKSISSGKLRKFSVTPSLLQPM